LRPVTQLVKKFPALYRTQRSITVFTRTRHSHACYTSHQSHNLDLITLTIYGEGFKLRSSLLKFYPFYSLLGPHNSSLNVTEQISHPHKAK
jgi:hypothetical protein